MKNQYNIKHNHREKARYAGHFQSKGFIPLRKEKINFSIGDVVRLRQITWRQSEYTIKKIFYNKYNELIHTISNGGYERECLSFEIKLLPLTRKVLIEKYNKETIEFKNGSFIVSGATTNSSTRIYIDAFNQLQEEVETLQILPTTRFRGRW